MQKGAVAGMGTALAGHCLGHPTTAHPQAAEAAATALVPVWAASSGCSRALLNPLFLTGTSLAAASACLSRFSSPCWIQELSVPVLVSHGGAST